MDVTGNYSILWDTDVSDPAKVIYIKLRERCPSGFTWTELSTICGSHGKTQRVRKELLDEGWIRQVENHRLYLCNQYKRKR
jgi:NAD(P)H-flavin reductase